MRRIISTSIGLALAVALLGAPRHAVEAGGKASPPQSSAFGKTLPEWMQLFWIANLEGGPDYVGAVKLLPLPQGIIGGGTFTYADPGVFTGHLDVTLGPGTPFVLPVVVWIGEAYETALHYPIDPVIPAEFFTDPSKAITKVYIDGQPVMDSTKASVSPFYFGPVPLGVVYPEPSDYGSISAIYVQGVGFVHPPLSVGVHTIALESELLIPPNPSYLNLNVYPGGSGIHFFNTWTITVSPKK